VRTAPAPFLTAVSLLGRLSNAGLTVPCRAHAHARRPKPFTIADRIQLLPDANGGLAGVLFGEAGADAGDGDPLAAGRALPAGEWRFAMSAKPAQVRPTHSIKSLRKPTES